MTGFAVLADDLTGALVSATSLRQRGLNVEVLWNRSQLPQDRSVEAVVADMRSRDASSGHDQTARAWAASLIAAGFTRLEYRMDSTLRGHAGEELAAIADTIGRPGLLVFAVPSSPQAGRVTQDGIQRIYNESSAARFSIDVAQVLFGRPADLLVDQALLASGGQAVADRILRLRGCRGHACVVADAESDSDLAVLGRAASLLAARDLPLLTVSPGAWLAHYPSLDDGDFTLVVIASPTRENHAQQSRLQARTTACLLSPADVLDGPADGWNGRLRTGATIVVSTITSGPVAWRHGEQARQAAAAAAVILDAAARRALRCSRVVVTGGHGAQLLMDALGATGLRPLDQAGPMCSRARIRGGRWDGLALVAKGGQLGGPETLVTLAADDSAGPADRRQARSEADAAMS